MQLSIIIPTYNRADVILRSLETWTKQTLDADKFEVIVVDNNSTDGSGELIQDFIKDYKNFHYLLETKQGSTNARHAGANRAKADILMFCDDDGLFNPDCASEILKVYKSNLEVVAVTGKILIKWDKTPPDWIEPYEFMLGKLDYGDKVKYDTSFYLNGGVFSIKKKIFNNLGGFNPDLIGNYLVGDGDTGLVIKLHKKNLLIGYTPLAVMEHLQFVDKQGSEKDMGRRFYNIGISGSYGFFCENGFKFNLKVFKFIAKSFLFYMKKMFEKEFANNNRQKAYFSYMQRKGELAFFMNLRIKEVRKEILEMKNK